MRRSSSGNFHESIFHAGHARVGLALLLACTSLSSGCFNTTYAWVKPDHSPAEAEAQLAACTLDAERSFFSTSEENEARLSRIVRWSELCMKSYGWKKLAVE